MSGDKLLGGPQAGLLIGSAEAIAACRRNPLTRALRVDKLTLAALEATLRLHRDPATAIQRVPVLAMLIAPVDTLAARAEALVQRLTASACTATVEATDATVGGGAFPTARIPSRALAFAKDPRGMEIALRAGRLPVIGRIERNHLLLDLRAIPPDHDDALLHCVLAAALRSGTATSTTPSALS
jgi:L-seryl-tRNA(Ser) seleniumtransferase